MVTGLKPGGRAAGRLRRRALVGLALVSLSLVPVAVSWACNPQAQLVTNKLSYAPDETMTISGTYFPRDVDISVYAAGQSVVVRTNNIGAFQTSALTAPGAPGTYTVSATRADGQYQAGLPKVASFAVSGSAPAPAPTPTPPTGNTNGNFVSDPTLRCGGLAVTLVGTGGDDVIDGSARRDVIAGLEGDDVIRGLGGEDVLCGGGGRDRLTGGRGNDRLGGGAGIDRLRGGLGRDRLNGGSGEDVCVGGPGRDRARRCETLR